MATCQPWCTVPWGHDACTRYTGSAGELSVGLLQDDTWPEPAVHLAHGDDVHVFTPLAQTRAMAALMRRLGHDDVADLIHLSVMSMSARGVAR